jgi:hypothetical protein
MAITVFRPGRRLFSTAAILMILTAAAHTAGNVAPRPPNPTEQKLIADMSSYRIPMGMGMNPSVNDIDRTLVFTMTITFAALGVLNLLLAASLDATDRLLLRVTWVNALWVAAFLILCVAYQVPPPLISAVVIEVAVVGSLVSQMRRAAGTRNQGSGVESDAIQLDERLDLRRATTPASG